MSFCPPNLINSTCHQSINVFTHALTNDIYNARFIFNAFGPRSACETIPTYSRHGSLWLVQPPREERLA